MKTDTATSPARTRGTTEQVFVDSSGRRARQARRMGYLLGVGCVGYIGMVALGLSGSPVDSLPGVTGSGDYRIIAGLSGQRGAIGLRLTPRPNSQRPSAPRAAAPRASAPRASAPRAAAPRASAPRASALRPPVQLAPAPRPVVAQVPRPPVTRPPQAQLPPVAAEAPPVTIVPVSAPEEPSAHDSKQKDTHKDAQNTKQNGKGGKQNGKGHK